MKTTQIFIAVAGSFAGGMLLQSQLQEPPPAAMGVAGRESSVFEGDRSPAPRAIRFSPLLSAMSRTNPDPPDGTNEPPSTLSLEEARDLFDRALASRRKEERIKHLATLVAKTPPELVPKIIAWADRIPGVRDREGFVLDLLARWAEDDPASALTYAGGISNRARKLAAMEVVLSRWGSDDPAASTDWVFSLPRGSDRNQLLVSRLSELSFADPERAFHYLTRLRSEDPGAMKGEYVVAPIFARWAESDPARASRQALALSDENERALAIQSVAAAFGEQDPDAALAWVESLPRGSQRDQAWAAVILANAERDPAAAVQRLSERADHPDAGMLASSVASTWADSDPEAALAWAERLPAGEVRDQALRSVGQQLAGDDPRRAFQLAQRLSDDNMRDSLLRDSVSKWALLDPREAARAIFSLAPSEARVQALADMVGNWSVSDPGSAADFVQRLPPGEEKDQAAIQLLIGLSYQTPRQAADYLTRFDGKVSDEVMGTVVSGWADQSLQEVTAWVVGLPAGATRDKACEALADHTFHLDPAAAIERIGEIQDEEIRSRAARTLMSRADIEQNDEVKELLRRSFPTLDTPETAPGGEPFRWGECTCTCPGATSVAPEGN